MQDAQEAPKLLSAYRYVAFRLVLESVRRDGLPSSARRLVQDAYDVADAFMREGRERSSRFAARKDDND